MTRVLKLEFFGGGPVTATVPNPLVPPARSYAAKNFDGHTNCRLSGKMEMGSGTILAADWAKKGTHLLMRVAQVSFTRHPGMAFSRNPTQVVQSTGGNVPLPISILPFPSAFLANSKPYLFCDVRVRG